MTPRLVEWSAEELRARADEVLEVYAEAMGVPRRAALSRRSILTSHLDREGLRAVAALGGDDLVGDDLVGIAYGYLGQPGQWWHEQVRSALDSSLAATWLTGAFEVCELHVRPAWQRQGLGRELLTRLLSGTAARTAVLTTPDDADTRARRFYRGGGWVELARGVSFPGDPRSFAVLGLLL